MTEKILLRFALLSSCLFSFLLFISYSDPDQGMESPDNTGILKERDTNIGLPQIIRAPNLNKQFTWGGEEVPNTADAMERLDRELLVNSYYHSSTILNLKLSERHFPEMRAILKEYSIPEDFLYLAVAESNLRNVTSYADARGFWQFRKLAAKDYNLEVNSEVDERYHLEKSTRAACKYLIWLKSRYGTWTDAAAAYNVGPGNYSSILSTQKEKSYYDLNINEETSRYIFRLIALKDIMLTPEKYGFYLEKDDKYPKHEKTKEIIVTESIKSLADFAHDHGITYRQLKIFNPWLIDDKLTVLKKTYKIIIPIG